MTACGFCGAKDHERLECPVEPIWLKNIVKLRRPQ